MNTQAENALRLANEVRLGGAAIRSSLASLPRRDAFLRAADLLLSPPPEVQRMRVERFLRALPRVGPYTAARILADAEVHGLRRHIGPAMGRGHNNDLPLSEGQRQRLAGQLHEVAARRGKR